MERKSILWLGAFALLAVVELTGEALENRSLILFSKPLLMPVLAIWLMRRTPGIRRFFRHTILSGLLFATLGDIFLMFAGGAYDALFFLLGLGAFLTTQACYLGGFLSEVNLRNGYLRKQPYWSAPFGLFLLSLLAWLWPGIPEGLQQPVALYGAIITAMVLGVVNLKGYVHRDVFGSLLAGALLFLLSDCLIAAGRFGYPFPGSSVAVMATYIAGQWLIVRGVAKQLRHLPVRTKQRSV
ncbi:MAG: lysoplasmalogenase [Lewinellaceae bacterium]|nr:lysoplasmalogenase [Lewinellaceae bacterium]